MSESITWMQDERLKNIPKEKLEFLQSVFFESRKLTKKEQLPFFLSLAAKSKNQNISLSEDEKDIILTVIKEYSTEEEKKKLDQFLTFALKRKT